MVSFHWCSLTTSYDTNGSANEYQRVLILCDKNRQNVGKWTPTKNKAGVTNNPSRYNNKSLKNQLNPIVIKMSGINNIHASILTCPARITKFQYIKT